MESRRVLRVVEAFGAQPPGPPEVRLCAAVSMLLDAAGVGLSLGASDDLDDCGLLTICAIGGAATAKRSSSTWARAPHIRRTELAGRCWSRILRVTTAGRRLPRRPQLRGCVRFSGSRCGPVRAVRTLTLYRHAVGELDCRAVLRCAGGRPVRVRSVDLTAGGGPRDELDQVFADTLSGSREVLQASGVASVQLGVSVGSALAVLRAHAFAESCSLSEVATQVIDRRLKFSDLRQ